MYRNNNIIVDIACMIALRHFLRKIQNVKKRVNFKTVFLLEGVIFSIQRRKQKLFSDLVRAVF